MTAVSVLGEPCPGCDDPIRDVDPVSTFGGRIWHRGCLDDLWDDLAEQERIREERRAFEARQDRKATE